MYSVYSVFSNKISIHFTTDAQINTDKKIFILVNKIKIICGNL